MKLPKQKESKLSPWLQLIMSKWKNGFLQLKALDIQVSWVMKVHPSSCSQSLIEIGIEFLDIAQADSTQLFNPYMHVHALATSN